MTLGPFSALRTQNWSGVDSKLSYEFSNLNNLIHNYRYLSQIKNESFVDRLFTPMCSRNSCQGRMDQLTIINSGKKRKKRKRSSAIRVHGISYILYQRKSL